MLELVPVSTESKPQADVARLQAAFDSLRANRWALSRTTAAERVAKLKRLREAIIARRDELAEAIHQDFRKPALEVELTEIHPTLEELNHTVKHLSSWMKPTRVGTPMLLAGSSAHVRYEARGVVLVLSPWNYPFQLLMAPLIAAIAAGNAVLCKPSEKTPHTARFLARLVRDVFPENEVALFEGGAETAEALLRLPFDHFFFTGNPRIGRKVMEAAAQHLASVTLELGGKSPAIIDESADVQAAAERLTWGKFLNSGQTCVAPDYIFVHESKKQQFVDAVKAVITRFYGETEEARQASPDFARLVEPAAWRRVKDLVDRTVAAGAKVEMGGVADGPSRYISPTVLTGVTPDMPIMEGEIFGPVMPVMTFRSRDEVYAHIQRGEKPLALYVFSQDKRAIEDVFRNTTSGGAVVNNVLIHVANPNLPFGGVGMSGLGHYHGVYGFRTFSHERAVSVQWMKSLASVFFPPYRGKAQDWASRATRLLE
ncbi:aldehyde dehydrogenase family protein [Myxococcus faecalis]|jgi:aldehyde dehydrogenase (NAD+)|uniref:aldehyde dehydrogenase family protein n=1 Tax=Myxococcus TaxID=32 RepID=UPI001CBD7E00|nr:MULTISPECIES: aldehyde dehydrogenase family protein [unclassified Myxococcus]MBZ4395667.1 aldehyde dehydrogenase family protein [Myxococcus sp. AS-1-15]MBZ4411280.1 aldehyde dehydrogenase family protein [Myxococcus sp. XM-1-1-1]BDT31023.1 aldehyde dehydrogenase family protein [Myxococcus sp. MH1]